MGGKAALSICEWASGLTQSLEKANLSINNNHNHNSSKNTSKNDNKKQ